MSDTRHFARGLVVGVILSAVLIALHMDVGAVMLTSTLVCLIGWPIINIGASLDGGDSDA